MALPDILDRITISVERKDRVLLHEQFTQLMILQDRARSTAHEHTIVHGTMREDGIDWPITECTTCDWWG